MHIFFSREEEAIIVDMGSAAHEAEEAVSHENGTIEDVVVVDNAQPHCKPPIHNIKS